MKTASSSWGFTNRSFTETINTTANFPTKSTKILYTNDIRTITVIFSLLIVVGVYLVVSLCIFCRRVKYVQDIVCQKNSAAKERFNMSLEFIVFFFVQTTIYQNNAIFVYCKCC